MLVVHFHCLLYSLYLDSLRSILEYLVHPNHFVFFGRGCTMQHRDIPNLPVFLLSQGRQQLIVLDGHLSCPLNLSNCGRQKLQQIVESFLCFALNSSEFLSKVILGFVLIVVFGVAIDSNVGCSLVVVDDCFFLVICQLIFIVEGDHVSIEKHLLHILRGYSACCHAHHGLENVVLFFQSHFLGLQKVDLVLLDWQPLHQLARKT